MSKLAQDFNANNITDPELKLQLISLQDKGSTVLSEDKAEKVALPFGFCCNYALQYVSEDKQKQSCI